MKYTNSCHCLQYRYVLVRHLKRDEVIHPLTELGKFRGEPVYPRANVLTLKTAENWMRQGRKVREGCQPMKMVKQHAVTVNKQRAIEMAMSERLDVAGENGVGTEKDVMQGLYAQSQTELYRPDPIVDASQHSISLLEDSQLIVLTYCRGRFRRMILATSIYIRLLCFRKVPPTYLVRPLRCFYFCY